MNILNESETVLLERQLTDLYQVSLEKEDFKTALSCCLAVFGQPSPLLPDFETKSKLWVFQARELLGSEL